VVYKRETVRKTRTAMRTATRTATTTGRSPAASVEGGCYVHMTIAWQGRESEAPKLIARAHRRGLVVLDPQDERLFRPDESS
jgi:hypothetical protein